MEFNAPSTGTLSAHFWQRVGTSCVAGQQLNVKIRKKVITAATGGSGAVIAGFTGIDGGSLTELTSSFTINATDSDYQSVDAFFIAPAGTLHLEYIGVRISSGVYSTDGSILRIDNVTALLEPVSIDDQLTIQDNRFRLSSVGVLTIEDLASTSYSNQAASLYYKQTLPSASEGGIVLARKDLETGNAPVLSLPGRLTDLGSQTIDSATDSLNPRIEAPISVASGANYTLLFQGTPSGAEPSRIYIGSDGAFVITKNLYWGSGIWNQDNSGNPYSYNLVDADRMQVDSSNISAISGQAIPFDSGGFPAVVGNLISKTTTNLILNSTIIDGIGNVGNCDFFTERGRLHRQGTYWYEDFINQSIASTSGSNQYVFVAGGGGDSAYSGSRPHSAYVKAGSSASWVVGNTSLVAWYSNWLNSMWMRVYFSADFGTTGTRYDFGLGVPNGVSAPTPYIYFDQQNNGAVTINVLGSSGSTSVSTTFTPTINTWYYFKFTQIGQFLGNGEIQYWISESENFDIDTTVTGSTFLVSVVPAAYLAPFFMATGTGGKQPSIEVDAFELWTNSRPT
jgi:hypothetical protein